MKKIDRVANLNQDRVKEEKVGRFKDGGSFQRAFMIIDMCLCEGFEVYLCTNIVYFYAQHFNSCPCKEDKFLLQLMTLQSLGLLKVKSSTLHKI